MKTLNSICRPAVSRGRFAFPIALAALVLGGCGKKEESTPAIRAVRSITVEQCEIGDPIVVTGHLRARDEVSLAFRISGRLIERTPDVGDKVKAGQTVARLDDQMERNARNAAQAELLAAQAAAEQSEAFEKRMKDLRATNAVSHNDYELALRQLKTSNKPAAWVIDVKEMRVHRREIKIARYTPGTVKIRDGALRVVVGRPSSLIGVPYDRPVVGYGGETINTLRLWAAQATHDFDFAQFSSGDFVGALAETLTAETCTRVLYPNDHTTEGKGLRFLQEYFLVACSLADLVRRFRAAGNDWSALPGKVAIQLNDTHPTLAVPELMRLLLDEARLNWDDAWTLTQRTLAYTNHTLLPEALEKWPVQWFQDLLPRHLEIIYEINRRLLDEVRLRYPGDAGRAERLSLIEEGTVRQVRMAHLAIVGSHSTNGVAALHSELLKQRVVPDFAAIFPERFNNKANGVTPRRWLLLANPALASVITDAIGDGWITDLDQLERLKPLADDSAFRAAVATAKRQAKLRFIEWLGRPGINPESTCTGRMGNTATTAVAGTCCTAGERPRGC